MVLGACALLASLSARAETVSYWDPVANGNKSANATVVTKDTATLSNGWYVVKGNVTRGMITVSGTANLILADGAKLTATDDSDKHPGIKVASDQSLNIYAQSVDTGTMGQLSASGGKYAAGIGGAGEGGTCGTLNIYGGKVTAVGGEYAAGIGGGGENDETGGTGGKISIYGGIVAANGENGGAGIGGGNRANGGMISIYGGEVIADNTKGDGEGAGIGGGYKGSGGTILIAGGKVTAVGGEKDDGGAGIGGGEEGAGGTIKITGGIVNATGTDYGAGIGGGDEGAGGDVTISGGTVVAKAGKSSVWDIGSGDGGDSTGEFIVTGGSVHLANSGKCRDGYPKNAGRTQVYCVKVSGFQANAAVKIGGLSNYGTNDIFADADGTVYLYLPNGNYTFTANDYLVKIVDGQVEVVPGGGVSYWDPVAKVTKWVDAAEVTGGTTLKSGWYVVKGTVNCGQIDVRGTDGAPTQLILADGCELKVTGADNHASLAVGSGNSLTIYGQAAGTGKLTAMGGENCAGIGGGNQGAGGAVTINGGTVTAMGGDFGAGIGGGDEGAGGAVTINGGTVTATGGWYGTGIGGGCYGAGGTVTINGGTVTATGGTWVAGIGGGYRRAGGTVTINGGTVTATGGTDAAGIGGGEEGAGGVVTINGGTVTAMGDCGAGIGGGGAGAGGVVTINGGSVTAMSRWGGAGIGGGCYGAGDTVTINGGTVTATGGDYGAGIGGGGSKDKGGDGGRVVISGGTVTATGGENGAGIGGGNQGAGGAVTINGGTVTATGGSDGADIGGGVGGAGGTLTIDGGSVWRETGAAARNSVGGAVFPVTVTCKDYLPDDWQVVFGGLGAYGMHDIFPIEHRICVYLPNGTHTITVSQGGIPFSAGTVVVNGAGVDAGEVQASGKLQPLIDAAGPNGTVTLEADTYDLGIVPASKSGLTIRGAGAEKTIVDPQGAGRGLTVLAPGVTVSDLTFRNGYAAADNLGGRGGGILGGDGAENLTVRSCVFQKCEAAAEGGGACGVSDLRASLLLNNFSEGVGGGCAATTASSCTFIKNAAAEADPAVSGGGDSRYCLFCGNDFDETRATSCATAVQSDFLDFAHGDYHLSSKGENIESFAVRQSPDATDRATLDLDGHPLVTVIDRTEYFYMGCYAFSPVPLKVVNDDGNALHENSNLIRSLADVLRDIAGNPAGYADDRKRCVIQFADSLAKDGVITIGLVQSCCEVSACGGGYRVVLQPPDGKRLVIDGAGEWRALHVAPEATLEVSGTEFRNCFGSSAGQSELARVTHGGAILNHGMLVASGCTFSGCKTGGGSKIFPAPTGNGGAVCNFGTAEFSGCTFDGNVAANGGALCSTGTGCVTVVSSTFKSNTAKKGNSLWGNNGGNGGAVALKPDAGDAREQKFVSCTFTANVAEGAGGAIWGNGGNCKITCAGCTFTGNKAAEGGDVVNDGPTDTSDGATGLLVVANRVFSGKYNITDAVTIRGDGTVELNPAAVVDGVKVMPVIGELPPPGDGEGDAVQQPFSVGSGAATLTIEAIPGLCYGLLRGETPAQVDEVVDWRRAESGTLTLEDFNAPKDGAFYRIAVRVGEF